MPFTATLTNGQTRLEWTQPEVAMGDAIRPVNIFRRTDGPETAGQSPTNWTDWTMIAGTVNSPWTDNVGPAPGFVTPGIPPIPSWYKIEDRTANSVVIPHLRPFVLPPNTNTPGSALWAHTFWGPDASPPDAVTSKASGDAVAINPIDNSAIVTGKYWAHINFEGQNTLFSPGNYPKVLLAKYTSNGSLSQSPAPRSLGEDVPNFITGLAVDTSGNNFLVGYFTLNKTSLGGPLLNYAGASDIMIGKLDSSFNHIWSRSIGSFGDDAAKACCVDSAGHLWVTGHQQGTVDFGGGFSLTGGAFLARLDKDDGHTIWAGNIPGSEGVSVAADLINNAIAVASNYGIVSVYSLLGVQQWTHAYLSGLDTFFSVAFDNTGNVFFGGYFTGVKSFGGTTWTSSMNGTRQSTIAIKVSPVGTWIWDQAYFLEGQATPYPLLISSIKVDQSGAVIFAGYALDSTTIEGHLLPTQGFWSPIILKYSSITTVSTFAWVKRLIVNSDDYLYSMAIDTSGRIVFCGPFAGTISFDVIQKSSSGNSGALAGYIAQYAP